MKMVQLVQHNTVWHTVRQKTIKEGTRCVSNQTLPSGKGNL